MSILPNFIFHPNEKYFAINYRTVYKRILIKKYGELVTISVNKYILDILIFEEQQLGFK
jgi:hypothetical protein